MGTMLIKARSGGKMTGIINIYTVLISCTIDGNNEIMGGERLMLDNYASYLCLDGISSGEGESKFLNLPFAISKQQPFQYFSFYAFEELVCSLVYNIL